MILGLDFNHKFRIGTDGDKDGKLFVYRDGKLFNHARQLNFISNIQFIKYQETITYTTAVNQVLFDNSTQLQRENNYVLKAHAALITSKN